MRKTHICLTCLFILKQHFFQGKTKNLKHWIHSKQFSSWRIFVFEKKQTKKLTQQPHPAKWDSRAFAAFPGCVIDVLLTSSVHFWGADPQIRHSDSHWYIVNRHFFWAQCQHAWEPQLAAQRFTNRIPGNCTRNLKKIFLLLYFENWVTINHTIEAVFFVAFFVVLSVQEVR